MRIVYDGLGTAGKTTNLRGLHAAFASRSREGVVAPEENAKGRTLFFDWLELDVGHLDDQRLRCEVISVPGQFAHARRRFHLLQEIDGAVLVCDSTPGGVRAGAVAATFLRRALASSGNEHAPIVLQANKQDLEGALAPEDVAAALPLAFAAVIGASATGGDGVRLTLLRTLDLVRDALRRRSSGAHAAAFPPHRGGAAQLFEALAAARDDVDGGWVDALEGALVEVR